MKTSALLLNFLINQITAVNNKLHNLNDFAKEPHLRYNGTTTSVYIKYKIANFNSLNLSRGQLELTIKHLRNTQQLDYKIIWQIKHHYSILIISFAA